MFHCFVAGNDSKPASARTVTLSSDQQPPREGAEEEDPSLDEAIVKIQAAYRGYQVRRSMKQPSSKAEAAQPVQPQEREPTREELEAEFQLDDPDMQGSWGRGG
ncbi:unnamed protein product [Phyllotreta striolata]|uniref:Uncharacterized protein n=1 Tax=Phyllotreta striolata TaxID=444603 RepID=A0A9N9U078_PHYSR|nr:unnamed protein product [Phyllotreta striolata]